MSKYIAYRSWYSNPNFDVAYEYRCDPVPFIHCRRGASYGRRYYKRPRAMQEKRAYFHDEVAEYGIKLRVRRAAQLIKYCWDDYPRSDFKNKNWKKHRKTQYKG